jgi:prephenate dehydrogenase
LILKDLRQITVIGLGLLGGSITLAVSRIFSNIKTVGFAHRPQTCEKARQLAIANEITDDLLKSVKNADLVILATPICTFEQILDQIADVLSEGCIVTDVGSTKVLPHKWAAKKLPKHIYYVGSHPIAGSEQRGVEFARDDLFDRAVCILTKDKNSNPDALQTLEHFWTKLGSSIKIMSPGEHDKTFAGISHLPHMLAAALVNASNLEELHLAGKGFIDTSRIASGPVNIWADILVTNAVNCTKSIDKFVAELLKLKKAIGSGDKNKIEKLLEKAREKRNAMINYKMEKKELI